MDYSMWERKWAYKSSEPGIFSFGGNALVGRTSQRPTAYACYPFVWLIQTTVTIIFWLIPSVWLIGFPLPSLVGIVAWLLWLVGVILAGIDGCAGFIRSGKWLNLFVSVNVLWLDRPAVLTTIVFGICVEWVIWGSARGRKIIMSGR